MIGLIKRLKDKKRLRQLKIEEANLNIYVEEARLNLEYVPDNIIFMSSYYKDVERAEMQLADIKEEIDIIEKRGVKA